MKLFRVLLSSLLMVALCVSLFSAAEAEYDDEILFRGLPWGISYTEASRTLEGEKFYEYPPFLVPDDLHSLVDWFPDIHVRWLTSHVKFNDSYTKINVAGYDLDELNLFFARTPDENGRIREIKANTALYAAEYKIDFPGKDFDKVVADLKQKLSDVYGKVYTTHKEDSGYWSSETSIYYIWKGKNETYACLCTHDKVFPEISIIYASREQEKKVKEADNLIEAEKNENATPKPYDTDNKDGL